MEKDRSEVEERWIDQAEQQWTIVEADSSYCTSDQRWVKDEPVSFDAGEGHKEQVDHVQRVMDPVPERAEYESTWIRTRGEHVGLGERESNGEKQKGDDEEEKNNMMVMRFAQ